MAFALLESTGCPPVVEVWRFGRLLCNKINLSQQMRSSPIPLIHGSSVNLSELRTSSGELALH